MKPTALLATIASDSHSWNLVFMEILLTENGFDVINLGPCTPIKLIAEKIEAFSFDLLVVSTVNGHGTIEASNIFKALDATTAPPAIIGGKLDTQSSTTPCAVRLKLLECGFDEVFEDRREDVFDAFQVYLSKVTRRKAQQTASSIRKSGATPHLLEAG